MSIDIRNLSIRYKTVQRAGADEGVASGAGKPAAAADECISADNSDDGAGGWRVDVRRQWSALLEQQRER